MSEGATLTAYMASAAITPRNDKPMAPLCQAQPRRSGGVRGPGLRLPAVSKNHRCEHDMPSFPYCAFDVPA